ncbi:MAG: DNA repair protein RecO [Treponema sp.]|nr:DNA repair protein RecO [Treponema sp.]
MSRNSSCQALVLATHPQGENNRAVTLLSAEEGIFYATLFGGPKSKLRAQVSPFNRGTIWLYKDEPKHSCKITDFDVANYHLSFRENLFKTWAASFAAEIVVKTKCAGSNDQCWTLVNGFLDGMELTDEDTSRLGLVRFLWRYLGLLGVRPETRQCASCGTSFLSGAVTEYASVWRASYEPGENSFVCNECADLTVRPFVLGQNALTYLEAVSDLSPRQVRTITVDRESLTQMKQLCFFLIEQACGAKLKTLESGAGIL